MAIAELFTQTIGVVRTVTTDQDEIGGASPDTTTTTEVSGYLEPRTGTEDLADRNTQVGDWVLYLPPDTDITGWDRVTHLAHTFDVIAPARPFWDPRNEEIHHLELDLREVE